MKPDKPELIKPTNQLYQYKAVVLSVYDGDTVTLNVNCGFDIHHIITVRLLGLNAPEVTGKEKVQGIISRDALRAKLQGGEVIAHTVKDKKEKFGRYLAVLYMDGVNLNDWMVENGFAEFKQY